MSEAGEGATGRPTKYRPEYARQAGKLVEMGAPDYELAEFFGVSRRTIYAWKNRHEDFLHATNARAREAANARVERSVFERCVGYTFESEKVFCHQGEVIRAKTTEHIPPDGALGLKWLALREPDRWRPTRDEEGEAPEPVTAISYIETDARRPELSSDADD